MKFLIQSVNLALNPHVRRSVQNNINHSLIFNPMTVQMQIYDQNNNTIYLVFIVRKMALQETLICFLPYSKLNHIQQHAYKQQTKIDVDFGIFLF
ncbi:hypothetical protein pb186bvf_012017 [Paramecium bursaria]